MNGTLKNPGAAKSQGETRLIVGGRGWFLKKDAENSMDGGLADQIEVAYQL